MRMAAYISIIFVALMSPWWFFGCCVFCYVLIWQGFELIPLAFVVDAQFGSTGAIWYLYLSVTLVLVYGAYFAKPYIRFYQESA